MPSVRWKWLGVVAMTHPPLTVDEAIARLAVVTHPCETCSNELDRVGEVATAHATHPPRRRTVHSYSLGGMMLGADWDEAGVHDWIRNASEVIDTGGWMGHGVAARGMRDGRTYRYAFETGR